MRSLVRGLALAAARPAWAESAPLRLTSISPAVADRGEVVTITGGSFGAGNLQVHRSASRISSSRWREAR